MGQTSEIQERERLAVCSVIAAGGTPLQVGLVLVVFAGAKRADLRHVRRPLKKLFTDPGHHTRVAGLTNRKIQRTPSKQEAF